MSRAVGIANGAAEHRGSTARLNLRTPKAHLGSAWVFIGARRRAHVRHKLMAPQSCRCLIDFVPREFDAECCNVLANFAEIVVRDAERYADQDSQNLTRTKHHLVREMEASNTGYILCDPHKAGWCAQCREEMP